jgi:hypothetical protein
VLAAIGAMENEFSSNLFIQVVPSALQADLQIRLIRILDESRDTSSFWYLCRCEPRKVALNIDLAKLRKFSARLKKVRDKVFVHIDKAAVFDPRAIYEEADIKGSEIVETVENVWRVLNRLYKEYEGKTFWPATQVAFKSLCLDFRRDFLSLFKV